MPVPMRAAPIRKMVMPVTMGGKMRRTARGGMKEIAIVVMQATMITPIRRLYFTILVLSFDVLISG